MDRGEAGDGEQYERYVKRRLEFPWAQQVIKALGRFYEEKPLAMEVDHIKAVALGGDVLGLDNLQMLCSKCHRIKTKDDVRKIAELRKGIRDAAG